MDGRLSAGDQVNTLDALKGRGATNHGDYWSVPLSENARGKLSLGDLTVLFQFVTEPPRQPKPMLPASVRGTFADRFDPRLSRDPRRVDHRALRDRDRRADDGRRDRATASPTARTT